MSGYFVFVPPNSKSGPVGFNAPVREVPPPSDEQRRRDREYQMQGYAARQFTMHANFKQAKQGMGRSLAPWSE
ncbi:MAG TPA: hypothetical protein VG984_00205 [Candidatus Paceibacterota bacterium]|nr:hypothetical protein [Candidatus Paceibacterota bacterium]